MIQGTRVLVAVVVMMMMVVGVVGVTMGVAVAVAVTMRMMCVVESHHADEIDAEAEDANGEQLAEAFHLGAADQSLDGLDHNLDADKPSEDQVPVSDDFYAPRDT